MITCAAPEVCNLVGSTCDHDGTVQELHTGFRSRSDHCCHYQVSWECVR